ncbi:hypothetical protein HHX47_DHR1000951 [Lentinula edodes]|nr:hypothetical protein HHX47_DHR1000951 [Lentinula edodes]
MPQMAPQVPQGHFHTQSPHPPQTPPPQTPPPQTPPPQTPPPQTPPPQTPPPQTPPPQTPPPQTPPPRSEDFQMDDVSATPRAPPDMTPRAPGPRNQPIMQQPPSPTIQKGKRRRVHDPEPGPSQSNDKTPGAQPTSHTGAQSNTQSNSQGPVDYLQALLNHQTKTMGELYHHLQNSTAEILKKQDQVLQKQDHKIDKVVTHLAQNTEILGRIGETLDMLSGKSKHKGSPGHQDEGDSDSQRHGSGSNQGPQPSNDGGAAAKPSDGGAAGSTTNRNNGNGDGEDGDDEGENGNPFFRYARKKQPARSGGVKHRPAEELKIKETMRKWLNEIMEGQDQLKETVSQDEADEFTLLFKTNPLARPCSVDNFRYWIAGGPKSAWNKGASYVFVEILEKRKLIATPDVHTRDAIREAFLLRLKTLHASWMERQKMQEDNKNPRSLFSKRWQRKNTLFHRRREVIITFHSLESFLSFFDELGVAGMSSDDEDPGMKKPQVQYIIKGPKWRSVELMNLLRLLDYCHLEGRCTTEATRFGYTRGAPPRIRIDRNDRSSKTKYVSGLPANFYDAQWLEEQEAGWAKGGNGFVNEFVRPQKPIKLIFPADLLKTLKERGYPRAQDPE